MFIRHSSPSGDQTLLDRAIAEFLIAVSAGKAGDRQLWLDRYPDCAAGLAEFFDDLEKVDEVAAPLRLNSPTSPIDHTSDVLAMHRELADTIKFSPQPPQFTSNRYRALRYHAGGGMGEIWLAEDERIGRHVALKKLRSGRDTDQSRFFVEAQITGQLEHPSVVPLHDLGFDDAGQPYYVMKFIRGRRLREAISQFHAQNTPADVADNVEFRRLLEILVNICNVVAYAHSKGVLHRDIKPDNVMLGPYGETLVVDWGLAKLIGQAEQKLESAVHLSGGGSTATLDGAIVGSPYYMSPEGAEGHPDAIDQTSDVYLLGATLYEILTDRPPRQGSSNLELIDLARHSRPTSPRKVNPRVPRPLEAICLKAMAFHKEDRYATPLALAEDIERFLAGAPVSAYQEPLLARSKRWLRRHRRRILRVTALAAILTLAGLALRSYREAVDWSEREQARQQLSEFYRLADEAQYFAANSDSIGERVPYYDPRRAEEVGKSALTIAAPWGGHAARLPLPEERDAFLGAQYSLLMLLAQTKLSPIQHATDPRAALAMLDQAQANHPPSSSFYQLRSRARRQLGESEAAKDDERKAASPDTPVTAQDRFLQGEHLRMQDVGATAAAFGNALPPSRHHLEAALDEYRAALQLEPRHYWAQFQLGRCLLALGRTPEAVEALSVCVAIRPTSPWAYTTRGLAIALSGRSKQALEDLNRAVALQPDFAPARLNRGVVKCWFLDDTGAAMEDFNAVLTGPWNQRLVEANLYRGQALLRAQKSLEALADFDSAINAQPDFAPAYWMRAKNRFQLGDVRGGLADLNEYLRLTPSQSSEAIPSDRGLVFGKTLRLMGQQLRDEPRRLVLGRAAEELESSIAADAPKAEAWQHLGAVQELLGRNTDAMQSYSKGLANFPADLQLRRMRGWANANHGKYELAQADFTEAIRISPHDAEAHAGLGFVLAGLGHTEDAQHEANTALLAGADDQLSLHYVACIFGRLSATRSERRAGNEDLAVAALQRAVAISRRNPFGLDADERSLITSEWSFPESLRSKREFKRLLEETSSPSGH